MSYTCDDIRKWALKFVPTFRFSKSSDSGGQNEYFYPVDAEGWIRHCHCDIATMPPSKCTNPNDRGTALYRWRAPSQTEDADDWVKQFPRIEECKLELNDGPSGIGNEEFTRRPSSDPDNIHERKVSNGDWYLDFGGWHDPGGKLFGRMSYIWNTYKTNVYDNLGVPSSSEPLELEPDKKYSEPALFNPDSRGLHTYAEFVPLRTILDQLLNIELPPELGEFEAGHKNIQGDVEQLADYLGLTYYLLYPGSVPPSGKKMEGQWEAITVFLKNGAGTPEFEFASYSQGYDPDKGVFPSPRAACRAAADVEKDDTHPVSYVAFGSHANYFTPRNDEQSMDPGVNGEEIGYTAAEIVGVIGAILVGASAWFVGAIVLVIALLIWLFTLLLAEDDESASSLPHDQGWGNDSHSGNGQQSGGSNSGTSDAPPTTTPGNPPFIVHPISAESGTLGGDCPPPIWWNYVGRWGVCVDNVSACARAESGSPSWSNGTWRRWPDGYTLTHLNVEVLMDYKSKGMDKTRTAYKPNPPPATVPAPEGPG